VAVGFLLFGILGQLDGKVAAAFRRRARSTDPALKVVVEFSTRARADFPRPLPGRDPPSCCMFILTRGKSKCRITLCIGSPTCSYSSAFRSSFCDIRLKEASRLGTTNQTDFAEPFRPRKGGKGTARTGSDIPLYRAQSISVVY